MLNYEYQVYWSSFQIYTTYNGITIYLILLIHATITCNTTYNTNMLLHSTAWYDIVNTTSGIIQYRATAPTLTQTFS